MAHQHYTKATAAVGQKRNVNNRNVIKLEVLHKGVFNGPSSQPSTKAQINLKPQQEVEHRCLAVLHISTLKPPVHELAY